MLHIKILLFTLIATTFIFSTSCNDKKNEEPEEKDDETNVINQFILENMNNLYLWNYKMPMKKTALLSNPEEYFYSLLYKDLDKWSYITDDYSGLIDQLNGVQKDFGYSIQLMWLDNTQTKIIALIEYIVPNSPADRAGLKRGDIIYKINNQFITESNFSELLKLETYTITLGYISNNTMSTLTPNINLTAEIIEEDPILLHTITNINNKKTGYLVYNSFISNYDSELINVFKQFKEEEIEELVLDLRYNGGGMVSSAQLLASMIGPSVNTGKKMISYTYNDNVTNYFKNNDTGTNNFELYFEAPLNLNLDRLFVLTSSNTASASEMIIYCLKPFINVIQIGMETTGKYYASTVIYDEKQKHNWAIMPLICQIHNFDNSIEYGQGLTPDYTISSDDYFHELGDENETMLNQALSIINGTATIKMKSQHTLFNIAEGPNNATKKKHQRMFIDPLTLKNAPF